MEVLPAPFQRSVQRRSALFTPGLRGARVPCIPPAGPPSRRACRIVGDCLHPPPHDQNEACRAAQAQSRAETDHQRPLHLSEGLGRQPSSSRSHCSAFHCAAGSPADPRTNTTPLLPDYSGRRRERKTPPQPGEISIRTYVGLRSTSYPPSVVHLDVRLCICG